MREKRVVGLAELKRDKGLQWKTYSKSERGISGRGLNVG
jgi:hypothetical protein